MAKTGKKPPTVNRCKQSKLSQTKAKSIENVKLNDETGQVKGAFRKKKSNVVWHMAFHNSVTDEILEACTSFVVRELDTKGKT